MNRRCDLASHFEFYARYFPNTFTSIRECSYKSTKEIIWYRYQSIFSNLSMPQSKIEYLYASGNVDNSL
jgi:hypothetical protein